MDSEQPDRAVQCISVSLYNLEILKPAYDGPRLGKIVLVLAEVCGHRRGTGPREVTTQKRSRAPIIGVDYFIGEELECLMIG